MALRDSRELSPFIIWLNGDTHMHVAWSRIDVESSCALDPGLYKNKSKKWRESCRSNTTCSESAASGTQNTKRRRLSAMNSRKDAG